MIVLRFFFLNKTSQHYVEVLVFIKIAAMQKKMKENEDEGAIY